MNPEETLSEGITARAFPGATFHLEKSGQVLAAGAVGQLGYEAPYDVLVTADTLYDLASVTKIYTAAAALILLHDHGLKLETSVRHLLPQFPESLTIRHLLQHTGGLGVEIQALHETEADRWLNILAQNPFVTPPGEVVRYSCSNAFVLARFLEALTGQPLHSIIQERILNPLGLTQTFVDVPEDSVTAPTETRPEGGFWQGIVHDEAARSWQAQTGGLCGNAGLFATASDVATFGRAWLQDLIPVPYRDLAFTDIVPTESGYRGLGWQVNVPSYMGEAPTGTGGHLGFTGPCLVVSPPAQAVSVILCNRVHPDRNGPSRLPHFQRVNSWLFAH